MLKKDKILYQLAMIEMWSNPKVPLLFEASLVLRILPGPVPLIFRRGLGFELSGSSNKLYLNQMQDIAWKTSAYNIFRCLILSNYILSNEGSVRTSLTVNFPSRNALQRLCDFRSCFAVQLQGDR